MQFVEFVRRDMNPSQLLSFHLPAAAAEGGWDATPHSDRGGGHGRHRACKYHFNLQHPRCGCLETVSERDYIVVKNSFVPFPLS